jgi:hypothetical protein
MTQRRLQEEAKNDGAVAGRGLSEVCYGTKYLYAMKKDPGAAILPVHETTVFSPGAGFLLVIDDRYTNGSSAVRVGLGAGSRQISTSRKEGNASYSSVSVRRN